jgi:hypothetical protein
MRKVDFSAGFITLLILTLAAIPESASSTSMAGLGMVMSVMDADKDHTLSLTEVSNAAARKFARMDMDHDKTLDPGEMVGIMTHQNAIAADRDHDGTLDHSEYLALTRILFQAADEDHGGTLDSDELSTTTGVVLVALLDY